MPEGLRAILPYALAATAAGVGGGVLAGFWRPGARVRSYVQHVAAGLVVAAVAVELLPHIREVEGDPAWILGGFAAGVLLMLGLKWRTQTPTRGDSAWGLAGAAALDTGVDGMVLGTAFAAEPEMLFVLTLALGTELAFLLLSVGAALRKEGLRRGRLFAITTAIAAMALVGAAISLLFLRDAGPTVLATALSFGTAALLYLVTEELLVGIRGADEDVVSAALLFLGFFVVYAIELLGG